jgi:hypothetical protein
VPDGRGASSFSASRRQELELVAHPDLLGQREPVQWPDAAGGLETSQRLVGGDSAAANIDDRLNVDRQALPGNQVFKRAASPTGSRVGKRVAQVDRELVLAGLLGDPQSDVRRAEERVGVVPVAGDAGDPDPSARCRAVIRLLSELVEQALRQRCRSAGLGDDGEHTAAEPTDERLGRDSRSDPRVGRDLDTVPRRLTAGLVDRAHVEADQEQGEITRIVLGGPHAVERGAKRAARERPGETVVVGIVAGGLEQPA